MAFTYVTITHRFLTPSNSPAQGKVTFEPTFDMDNGGVTVTGTRSVDLTGSGDLSVLLAANTDTDPATTPTGVTYRVTERFTGELPRIYFVQVPHDQGPTLDLRALSGWIGGAPAGGVGGGGTVASINGELPDGAGNIVVSASDVGAQPADADLDGISALGDGVPRRAGGVWAARSAQQLAIDLSVAPTPVTLTASSGVVTPNAALGPGPHRYIATADVTLAGPTGGVDGQTITVWVTASGAQRTVSFGGGTVGAVPVAVGDTYIAHLTYSSGLDEWKLEDGARSVAGTGTGTLADGSVTMPKLATTGTRDGTKFLRDDGAWTAVAGGGGAVSSVNGLTGVVVLTQDSVGDGTTNKGFTATEKTKLAGVAAGATANATDAQLRDRATHTGTQSADSLVDGSTNKAYTAAERTKLSGVATGANVAYATVQDEGSALTARTTINFTGAGVTVADNTGSGRTDVTIPGGSALATVHAVGNSGSALTLNPTVTGPVKTVTLTANCTMTFAGATAGSETELVVVLKQDATGSRTVTWPAAVKWSGGAPVLSTAANAVDRLVFTSYDGGTIWYGDLVGKGYA